MADPGPNRVAPRRRLLSRTEALVVVIIIGGICVGLGRAVNRARTAAQAAGTL